MQTTDFDYELPEAAIAQEPVEPRDTARLLLTSDMSDHLFSDLPAFLGPDDLLVVNDTRVRAARLHMTKEATGGAVEVLLLERLDETTWTAMARPARRLHPGTRLVAGNLTGEVLTDPEAGVVTLALRADGDVEELVRRQGEVPLPPYITTPLDDPDRYQTVYAQIPASAAAPTAGLHFTDDLLTRLEAVGTRMARIELRVGLATFRPIATERVEDHAMHSEWVAVPESTVKAIEETRRRGGNVVAVGTTVVRALESAARDGKLAPFEGHTDLFITPGFTFRVVDRLITNFHMPRSSLLVLIAAFMGPRWRNAYATALERGYRFLSFGDAMFADRVAR